MNMQVGDCKVNIRVYVAPVSDNLFGLSFLRKVGAKIDLDKLQLVIGSQRIDCRTRDNKPLYVRVVTECDIRVPGEHEMIVPYNLAGDLRNTKLGMLEPINRPRYVDTK